MNDEVKFWENIFSKYSSKQCVFHDDRNLEVVYSVKTIPLGYRQHINGLNMKKFS